MKTGETDPIRDDDRRLLHRAALGDVSGFEALVDRYSGQFLRLAYGLVGERGAAEDVVQETFAGAYRALKSFRGEAEVRTWLVSILVRQAARHSRRERLRRHLPIQADVAGNASDAMERSDVRIDLAEALAGIEEHYRQVIVLREIEGLSYDEIAAALSLPRGTVESRIHRARKLLRDKLRDYIA